MVSANGTWVPLLLGARCLGRPSSVARQVVQIRLEDDAPEEVQDTDKYHDGKELAYSFRQVLLGVVALGAGLRGLIWVDIGSKGAVVWRRAD